MSNLVDHAKRELAAFFGETPADPMNAQIVKDVVALLEIFADQGHSGMSASFTLALFAKLAAFEPLGPLTGADSEWVEVGEQNGKPLYQNRRCGRVFKEGDRAYDIDGIVFQDPDGSRWTNGDSRVDVTFPYTPTTTTVLRGVEGVPS